MGVCACVCVSNCVQKYMNINKGQAILFGNVFVAESGQTSNRTSVQLLNS